ncbi:DMT family transporter [Dongshaea marina]|uniref:DMT family transporter n=1 Tax=Dongshaea marina TaxID=2047966 RepID=UPI000D3E0890|nr:DMT family transporter [Dongshaea marina]
MKSSLILLLAALIWGLAYVAQRAGMDYIGPYTFNALRFLLGTLSLLPVLWLSRNWRSEQIRGNGMLLLSGGLLMGFLMFLACSLQQVGLVTTSAGKTGFITGIYIVMVPLFGLLLRHKTGWNTWLGILLAVVGLYLLSVTESFTIHTGDLLILGCAVIWAIHLLTIDHFSTKVPVIKLAFLQFAFCTLLSSVVALFAEPWQPHAVAAAWIPLLYAGVMSVGVGFTLQIFGQQGAHPAHAAIILSLEALFAAIGGWVLLSETMSTRSMLGCGLMLLGMLASQLPLAGKKERAQQAVQAT